MNDGLEDFAKENAARELFLQCLKQVKSQRPASMKNLITSQGIANLVVAEFLQRYPDMRDPEQIRRLIACLVRNKLNSRMRTEFADKRSYAKTEPLNVPSELPSAEHSTSDFNLVVEELIDRVRSLDKNAIVVLRRLIEGCSQTDIASELDMSPSNVRRIIGKIRSQFPDA